MCWSNPRSILFFVLCFRQAARCMNDSNGLIPTERKEVGPVEKWSDKQSFSTGRKWMLSLFSCWYYCMGFNHCPLYVLHRFVSCYKTAWFEDTSFWFSLYVAWLSQRPLLLSTFYVEWYIIICFFSTGDPWNFNEANKFRHCTSNIHYDRKIWHEHSLHMQMQTSKKW